MNWAESTGAEQYRDHLRRTVEIARSRLSERDFRAFAAGIRQEIARLDNELSQCSLQSRISCGGLRPSASIIQSVFPTMRGESPSIRFNSPVDVSPWTSRVLRYDTLLQSQTASGISGLSYVS